MKKGTNNGWFKIYLKCNESAGMINLWVVERNDASDKVVKIGR